MLFGYRTALGSAWQSGCLFLTYFAAHHIGGIKKHGKQKTTPRAGMANATAASALQPVLAHVALGFTAVLEWLVQFQRSPKDGSPKKEPDSPLIGTGRSGGPYLGRGLWGPLTTQVAYIGNTYIGWANEIASQASDPEYRSRPGDADRQSLALLNITALPRRNVICSARVSAHLEFRDCTSKHWA